MSSHSCGSGPGSLGHYKQDALTFAHDWQADYLKVDFVSHAFSGLTTLCLTLKLASAAPRILGTEATGPIGRSWEPPALPAPLVLVVTCDALT